MDFNPSSDSDAIYVWRAVGHEFNSLPVYKFGTTSARLEDRRITEVARFAKMDFEIVVLTKVTIHASELEAQLLKFGANPMYEGFNGASEFRALTDEELQDALDLISKFTWAKYYASVLKGTFYENWGVGVRWGLIWLEIEGAPPTFSM